MNSLKCKYQKEIKEWILNLLRIDSDKRWALSDLKKRLARRKESLGQGLLITPVLPSRIPTVKLKIPGKNIKSVFHIFYGNVLAKSQPLPLVDSQGQKLSLECNRSSGFQKCFSRNFQFHRRDPNYKSQ